MIKTLASIAIILLVTHSCGTKKKVSRPSFIETSPTEVYKKKKK
jgi:hypothetical protein